MENPKPFDFNNLLTFHKVQGGVPRSVSREEEKIAELDPKLSSEDWAFVHHYLAYADILLAGSQDEDELNPDAATEKEIFGENIVEMNGNRNQEQPGPETGKEGNTEAA